jgi:tRNA modification GTPase
MYAEDTIAAIATPPGPGGIGVVRVSGPFSAAVARSLFAPSHQATTWASHHLYHGHIVDEDGGVLDEGLAVLMRRPHSYTGENVLELHCHGSPVLLRQILRRVLRCGVRLAEPGEFTRRAFLNGRLDLAQAEAVMEVVHARTAAGAALATQQLTGHLSAHLANIRTQLVGLKALLETQIDFAEDEVEVSTEQMLSTCHACITSSQRLIDSFGQGTLLREGVRVAIIGKPNVGKSSLLNALLGTDRAIVTAVPGTTRDSIEETADFEGVPVILTDTAGLRAPEQADAIERLGIERTTVKMATADFLLPVLDASAPLDAEDRVMLEAAAGMPQVVALNKTDLPRMLAGDDLKTALGDRTVVAVSAKDGSGLDALRRAVIARVSEGKGFDTSDPVLVSVRHRDALEKARASLHLARESMQHGLPADIIAVDVQDAVDFIGQITGEITNEDVLDRIFSEFCIGK